jgi:MFS family permease
VTNALGFIRGNVLVLTVCSILWRISVDVVRPYLALYIMALGGSYETIGLVMAVGNLAGMLLYPLGGYIADYQGRIKVMAYMTYVYSLTFLIFVFTESWMWVAIGMFAQSLVTFYTPAMQALMADSLPPGRRGLGFAATFAIPSAFGIASPLIGGWLIDIYGITPAIKGLYFLGFLIAIVVATLRLKFLRETLRRAEVMSIRLGKIPELLLKSYRDVVRMIREAPRRLLVLSLLMAGCTFFVSLVMPFWIIRATEVIGINPEQWGTIMLVSGAVNVLLSLPAGSYVDRHRRKNIAGVCLIAGSIPVFLFLYATTFEQVVALKNDLGPRGRRRLDHGRRVGDRRRRYDEHNPWEPRQRIRLQPRQLPPVGDPRRRPRRPRRPLHQDGRGAGGRGGLATRGVRAPPPSPRSRPLWGSRRSL